MKYTNLILRLAVLVSLFVTTSRVFAQNTAPAGPRPAAAPSFVPPPSGPQDPQADWVTKIFELKFAMPSDMRSILMIFRAEIQAPGLSTGKSRLISVRAPKEIMPAIEDTITRFDVAPPPSANVPLKNIEVSVQVLGAYDSVDSAACKTCVIPQSLQPVITQLQKNFLYKGYQLLDTQVYRQRVGVSLSANNSLPGINDPTATYSIYWRDTYVPTDMATVHLRGFKFGTSVYLAGSSAHFGFETEVDIPTDQQVVIGKTTVGSMAVILVIRAKVVD